jgi:hypothetical protein
MENDNANNADFHNLCKIQNKKFPLCRIQNEKIPYIQFNIETPCLIMSISGISLL